MSQSDLKLRNDLFCENLLEILTEYGRRIDRIRETSNQYGRKPPVSNFGLCPYGNPNCGEEGDYCVYCTLDREG